MGLPWLYQLKGELLLMQRSTTEAETCFRQAINIARAQNDRMRELSATTQLARLLAKERREQARSMLAEIYNWFTEGFETVDLREAKVLLDELS